MRFDPGIPTRRTLRRLLAAVAAVLIVFAQVAVSAYACPVPDQPRAVPPVVHGGVCGDDAAPDARCLAHCHPDTGVVTPELPLPAFAMLVDSRIGHLVTVPAARGGVVVPNAVSPGIPPPAAIAFCRLRF